MTSTRFIADILEQPVALEAVLARSREEAGQYRTVAALARSHQRIIFTGMGASFAALLPPWRRLAEAGMTTWHVDTSELLNLTGLLQAPGTLLIAASQSGHSAELVALAGQLPGGASLVAITNDPESPLARHATATLLIHAGKEHAVSTRSYLNTLAVGSLLAAEILGTSQVEGWKSAPEAIHAYLADWRDRVDELKEHVNMPERAVILAREDSIAAALYGALILKEAAKAPVEALTAAQFRHGPLELADARLTAFVIAGLRSESRLRNLSLAADVQRYAGRAFWLDPEPAPQLAHVSMPKIDGPARVAAEVLPLQLLSVALAELSGIEPGAFRHLQKVTTVQ